MRVRALGLLVVGLLVGVLGLQLGHDARWDPQWVFSGWGFDVVAWLAVGACLVVGVACTLVGTVWVVFAAPAVRTSPGRAGLIFAGSIAFGLVAVLTGVWTDGDMLALVGSGRRSAPAWVLIVLSLVLALPGTVASVRSYLLGPDGSSRGSDPKP
ncbi:hypothetical protein GCM10027029_00400 [Conyzicola lurida]